uniref:Succinate dehydrogenase [ubiquinone] cytochrome b small subunit n=1 Tax=Parascaris univalens TaxID=6257 RepID=A0A915A514_PARUN
MSLIRCVTSKALKYRQLMKMAARTSVTVPVSREPFSIEDHSLHFKIERYWAAGMIPLFPSAYFIHTPAMDAVLTVAIVLHVHWGIAGIVSDYARPFVMGDYFAKLARASVYIITVLLLVSLLHFNNSDVGLTKAFEMVWSL